METLSVLFVQKQRAGESVEIQRYGDWRLEGLCTKIKSMNLNLRVLVEIKSARNRENWRVLVESRELRKRNREYEGVNVESQKGAHKNRLRRYFIKVNTLSRK